MTIGKNRSPHQTFGRSDFEPYPSDRDLLPKPVVSRPVTVPELEAPDIEGLPWVRQRGQEWTTEAFRTRILEFIRDYMKTRDGLVAWKVVERAAERGPLGVDQQYLQFIFTRRTYQGCDPIDQDGEVGMSFPEDTREGSALEAQLVALTAALDATV